MTNFNFKQYLDSSIGKEMTNLFSIGADPQDNTPKLEKIFQLVKDYLYIDDPEDFLFQIQRALDSYQEAEESIPADAEKSNQKEFFKALLNEYAFGEYADSGKFISTKDSFNPNGTLNYRVLATTMPYLSIALYIFDSGLHFYPVLYSIDFSHFIDCCNVLGIDLPKIPLQKDKFERCMYMEEICECIEAFRVKEEITKEQTCALLYGYANEVLKYQKNENETAELPSPTRIWITGASKEDVKYNSILAETSVWAGNERTKRGDIYVLYALSPHSKIISIWRAVSGGAPNPFDYYTNRIVMGQRIEVPAITFDELKADDKMSQAAVVRNNLNGINGRELTYEDYQNLLAMIARKGFDINTLPNLEAPSLDVVEGIDLEEDVSNKQVKPLLAKLGYSEKRGEDWDQEVQLKLGRDRATDEHGYKGRPDFAFFVKEGELGQKRSPFLIEVKYYMKDNAEAVSAISQAISYADHLHSPMIAVCDREVFRVYKANKSGNFSIENSLIFDQKWTEINSNPEVFNQLLKLIGRDEIKTIKV